MGQRFIGVAAYCFDAMTDGLTWATWCGEPLYCPNDALDALGWERGLIRGPSELLDQFRLRVHGAWEAWEWSGTVTGIELQLVAYGLQPVIIEAKDYDEGSVDWSRFQVLFPVGAHAYTDPVPVDAQRAIRAIVRRWKNADTRCELITVFFAGRLYGYPDDGLTYGEADAAGMTYGDTQVHQFAC